LAAPSGYRVEARSLTNEDIVPIEYINEVHAYHEALSNAKIQAKARSEWKKAKRVLSTLNKRVAVDSHCAHGDLWISRQCMSDVSPTAYEDECENEDGEDYKEARDYP
jgi:hypothetical protein